MKKLYGISLLLVAFLFVAAVQTGFTKSVLGENDVGITCVIANNHTTISSPIYVPAQFQYFIGCYAVATPVPAIGTSAIYNYDEANYTGLRPTLDAILVASDLGTRCGAGLNYFVYSAKLMNSSAVQNRPSDRLNEGLYRLDIGEIV